jgi:A/G-specific adenine glycosylase
MQLLRSNDNAVSRSAIDILWHDPAQLQRALDALIAEGLVDPISDEAFALPS